MSRVTDCDYCGEIRMCVDDHFGGTCCSSCEDRIAEEEFDDDDQDDYDDDGQPDEYTEWQDYYGGDDWDHGQYDCEW